MTRARPLPLLVATLVFWVAGCSTATEVPSNLTTMRDSAGVRLVTIHATLAELPEWHLSPEPEVHISGMGGDSTPYLSRVANAVWMHDGSVLVGDRDGSQIHIYSADGDFLRSFGKEGDGPGEFKRIMRVSVTQGDTILVFDASHNRVSIYDASKGLVRSIPLAPDDSQFYSWKAWSVGTDRVLGLTSGYDPEGFSGAFPRRAPRTARLTLHDGGGGLVAGPIDFDGGFSVGIANGGDVVAAFANIPAVGVEGDRVVFSAGLHYELTTLDHDLRPVGRVSWPGVPEPVTGSEVEWLRGEVVKQWEEFPNAPQEIIDQVVDGQLAPKFIPENRPEIGSVVLDRQGRTWVSRFEPMQPYVPGRVEAWHVLDPEGTPRGRLTLPMGAELMAVDGDRVMLLTTDELDVQHIAIFRVIMGEGK